jgi:hypothetical protein
VPALLAVGLEGFWGVVICAVGLPLLALFKDASGAPFDDALAAVREIRGSQQLQVAVGGSIISIAFFNFFGISVTKSLSGAARATIDACRWAAGGPGGEGRGGEGGLAGWGWGFLD